jgi:hypothetical protein
MHVINIYYKMKAIGSLFKSLIKGGSSSATSAADASLYKNTSGSGSRLSLFSGVIIANLS